MSACTAEKIINVVSVQGAGQSASLAIVSEVLNVRPHHPIAERTAVGLVLTR